jgi:hypothetical protein
MHPRRFTSELKAMREAGLSLEESLSHLRSKGASIIECIVAVKEETGCELGDAKRVVHQSKTWRDVAEATEVMWDELITALEKEEPNQPIQRNASTGSVSIFESPARRG